MTIRTRAELAQFADEMLLAARPFASPGNANILLPGTPGGYGAKTDALEGFARTFLLAGFQLAGAKGEDPHGHAEFYARGLVAGTDPTSPERWWRPKEMAQAKVEAASLALILDISRPWIWDRLDPHEQEHIVDYLAEIVGDETYPRNNWLWFRIVVETFLRSVGGPHSLSDIEADLERHDSYYEREGWYRDGEERAYDHYAGWAMHLYPALWARMSGAEDLAEPRAAIDVERLDRFLQDFLWLSASDGAPLIQGRSLVYRFATAAAYWAGVISEVPSVPAGDLRDAALGNINYFRSRGVPNARGLLDLGWTSPWRPLAQRYSGTGSPYWAAKGMAGLILPEEHPVWQAEASPKTERTFAIAAPTWAVTRAGDGIARIANHGADHAHPGDGGGDSPLYARLAYSTATAPLLDRGAWANPIDNSVVLLDETRRRSHRSGMRPLGTKVIDDVALAASTADAHWLVPDPEQINHGSGLTGTPERAGEITTVSLLRGEWEVRVIDVAEIDPAAHALEAGGWPLADNAGVEAQATDRSVRLASTELQAEIIGLLGWESAGVSHHDDASPLGAHAAVGTLMAAAEPGRYALALRLTHAGAPTMRPPRVETTSTHVVVTWADDHTTEVAWPTGINW